MPKTSSNPDSVPTANDSAAQTAPAVSETTPSANSATTTRKPRRKRGASSASTLDQAQAVCEALREALDKSRQLVRAIKRQKRQRRLVETTLASLQELQSVA